MLESIESFRSTSSASMGSWSGRRAAGEETSGLRLRNLTEISRGKGRVAFCCLLLASGKRHFVFSIAFKRNSNRHCVFDITAHSFGQPRAAVATPALSNQFKLCETSLRAELFNLLRAPTRWDDFNSPQSGFGDNSILGPPSETRRASWRLPWTRPLLSCRRHRSAYSCQVSGLRHGIQARLTSLVWRL